VGKGENPDRIGQFREVDDEREPLHDQPTRAFPARGETLRIDLDFLNRLALKLQSDPRFSDLRKIH
jgi:hypothetical protein